VILVACRPHTRPSPFGSATLDGRPLAIVGVNAREDASAVRRHAEELSHEWGSAPAHALLGALLAEPVSRAGAR
jgi:hypothetical protein